MSDLLRIIGLLYQMQAADIATLERDLLQRRKAAWRQALSECGQRYGSTRPPNPPSREDLAELKRMCREDARSIATTWNRDVERQLQKLYTANPKGNRHYYAKQMEAWAQKRAVWKNPQIALQTEQTTRFYAQDRFRQMNGLRGGQYVFQGPPPVCGECVGHFAAGLVDEVYVHRHPAPVHIGCPHEWYALPLKAPPPRELWLG
jgi:hypothetical protein